MFDVDGIYHVAYYTMQEASNSNDQRKYIEAADLFRETISRDPDHADAYYYIGFMFENGKIYYLNGFTYLAF